MDQVTAYLNGVLVWGKEPGGSVVPSTQPVTTPPATTKPPATTIPPTDDPNAIKIKVDTVNANGRHSKYTCKIQWYTIQGNSKL